MATSPTIIPLTPPRNVGLRSRLAKMSQITQVNSATAVATLVFSTASDALAPEKYGAPAVESVPVHPENPGADGSHGQVVRHRAFAVTGHSGSDHGSGDEAGGA